MKYTQGSVQNYGPTEREEELATAGKKLRSASQYGWRDNAEPLQKAAYEKALQEARTNGVLSERAIHAWTFGLDARNERRNAARRAARRR